MGLPPTLFLSILLASLSTILTCVAICCWLLLRCWKRRDCIATLSVLLADLCLLAAFLTYTAHKNLRLAVTRASSILFATFLLTSCTSQFVVTLNRFVVVNFPFAYKRHLSRAKLAIMSATVWVGLTTAALACVLTSHVYVPDGNRTNLSQGCIFPDLLLFVPEVPLAAGISTLLLLLLVVAMMELLLWLTAYGHESRYHSVVRSVSRNARQSEMTVIQNNQVNRIKVRRIPFLLLGTHLVCIMPLCVVSIAHLISARATHMKSYELLGMIGQALLVFRPTLNAINHIAQRKLQKSWTRLAVKMRRWTRNYPDSRCCHQKLGSDYLLPYENCPHRRESDMSNTTNVSVV